MAGINLGVIFSEIRLSLSALEEDAAAAKETLAGVQEALGSTGSAAGAAASAGLEEAGTAAAGMGEQLGAARESLAGVQDQLGATGAAAEATGSELAASGEKAAAAGAEGHAGIGGLLGPLASVALSVEMVKQGFDFLKDTLGDLINVGMQSNQVEAQTEAGLRSTHDASGMTAQSIAALADKMMRLSGIDDDSTQTAENMLLTFTNIGHDVFPQATQATADLATKMACGAVPSAIQMQQAALQLGKALGDPTKGYAQLQRVGVTFTAQQIAQIKQMQKAGDVAGAQKIILAEMNREFGGSAAAAGKANGGIAIFRAELEHTKEVIGQGLIGALNQMQRALAPLGTLLLHGLVLALDWLRQHGTLVKSVLLGLAIALTVAVVPALWSMTTAAIAAETGVIPMAISIAAAAAPVIALGLAIGGLIFFLKHLFETNKGFHDLIANKVLPIIRQLGAWFKQHIQAAIQSALPVVKQIISHLQQFGQELSTRLGPALQNIGRFLSWLGGVIFAGLQVDLQVFAAIWNAVWPAIQGILQSVWTEIQGIVEIAWSIVSGIIKVGLDLLGGKWGQAWKDIQSMLAGVWDGIKKILQGAIGNVLGLIGNLVGSLLGQLGDLKDKAIQKAKDLVTDFLAKLAELPGDMLALGGQIVQGLINGLKNGAGNLGGAVKNLAGNVLGSIKGVFGIASPSRVMAEIGGYLSQGLIQGLQSVDVARAAAAHYGRIASAAQSVAAAAQTAGSGLAAASGAGANGTNGNPLVGTLNLTVQVSPESGDGTPEGAGTTFGQALGTQLGPALRQALRQYGY